MDAGAQATKEHPPSATGETGAAGPSTPGCSTTRAPPAASSSWPSPSAGSTALLLIAQAWLIARIVAGAFLDHQTLGSLRGALLALLAVVAGRSVLAWSAERTAHRASASAKSELRRAAAEHVAALGPAGLEGSEPGRLSTLLTTGIDALDGYFARYLPQLFLAVIVPVAVIAVVAGRGLGQCRADRRQPAPHPDLHGPGRGHHAGPDAGPHALPPEAGRSLPRRGGRAAHAQGLRAGQGPGPVRSPT